MESESDVGNFKELWCVMAAADVYSSILRMMARRLLALFFTLASSESLSF